VVKPDNKNNWLTALSEAAFMTGLERNADVVI
jgi:alpha-N-arabinofuranosidase